MTMQLALGTVQFGLAYGIAGRSTPVAEPEVRTILEDAAARGVRLLDTAAAYGDIEERLAHLARGLPLRIVSKVQAIPDDLAPEQAAALAVASARRSQARLGDALSGLMLHRAQDATGARGAAVVHALGRWADAQGVVLGVSCYGPDEALALQRQRRLPLTQLPGNALDQRVANASTVAALQGVEVHLRSVFLQGLLLMPPAAALARLPAAATALQRWHAWCASQGLGPLSAALAVVKSFAAVSTVVVGVDSLAQWRAIADAWQASPAIAAPQLASSQADIIDPRQWKLQP